MYSRSMTNELMSWWAARMLELVPEQLLRRDATRMDALLLRLSDTRDRVGILVRRKGQQQDLGEVALNANGVASANTALAKHRRPKLVLLCLQSDILLERTVMLPYAALRHVDQLLVYEMDRLTPFTADEVFWNWAPIKHDRARNQLHLRLSLVPKAGLREVLMVLSTAGLGPVQLAVPMPCGETRLLPLDHAVAQPRHQRAVLLAAAATATLAVAVVAAPFALQLHQIMQLDSRAGELRPIIAEVDAARRRMAESGSGADVFAAEATRVGSVVRALATLTEVLPDDTYLTALTLRQGKMTFTGRSAGAARLITALSVDPAIRDPAFLAPVTRGVGGGGDSFSIRAELGR